MGRSFVGVVVLALALGTASGIAAPPSISSVSPATVHRGHTVVVKGSADGCAVGNTVTLISRAFLHPHDFAGLSTCYVAALPFFQNTLSGDLFWMCVLFGGHRLVRVLLATARRAAPSGAAA